jgi:hypothetical protein
MKPALLILALLALELLSQASAGTTSSQQERIIDCGYFNGITWTARPQQGYGYHLTTRHVRCAYARLFSKRYHGTDTFYPAWNCREINAYESLDIRCVSGSRVIRWVGGD